MRLSAPKEAVFWIAAVLGVLGILGAFVTIPVVTPYHFWLLTIGFVLLALSNLLKGL